VVRRIDSPASDDAPTTIVPAVPPMPTRPTPRRAPGLAGRLAPWAVFAVVAVVVLAATSAWSASLRGYEAPAEPAAALQVPPGPLPPRPAAPGPATPVPDAVAAAPAEDDDGAAPEPTVLPATVPDAPEPPPPVLAAPAVETAPAAEPPLVAEENVIPPPARVPVQPEPDEGENVRNPAGQQDECADEVVANRPRSCPPRQPASTTVIAPATPPVVVDEND